MLLRTVGLAILASNVMAVTLPWHASVVLVAQTATETQQDQVRPPDENTPREIIYPYYSLREGGESKLVLMDHAPRPIEFTIAIHATSGQTVWAKAMTIEPQERLEISIEKLLSDLGVDYRGDFYEGSVSLHFKGTGNPIGGRMIVKGLRETWNLGPVRREGEFGQNMIPERLDSLWWDLGGARDAEMNVNNVLGKPIEAEVYLDIQGKRHSTKPLHFAPYQMVRLSLTELLAGIDMTAYKAPSGGITIVAKTNEPALIAQGKLTDAESRRQSVMVFPLLQMYLASALHATGIPISVPREDSPYAGLSNFTPHIYARNLLDSPQTITLTIEYPGEAGPQLKKLAPFIIPGFTTQDIRLDAYYNDLPLPLPYCALRIEFNGPPGSLIADVNVVSEEGDVIPVGATNEGNGYAGSLVSYWGIDDETDIYVFLTNMGGEDCRVAFRVDAGGVEYHLTDLKLIPRETKVINMRELRDRQQADFRGSTIPANATEGRLYYIRMDPVPMMGRVVVVPRRKTPQANGPP